MQVYGPVIGGVLNAAVLPLKISYENDEIVNPAPYIIVAIFKIAITLINLNQKKDVILLGGVGAEEKVPKVKVVYAIPGVALVASS